MQMRYFIKLIMIIGVVLVCLASHGCWGSSNNDSDEVSMSKWDSMIWDQDDWE